MTIGFKRRNRHKSKSYYSAQKVIILNNNFKLILISSFDLKLIIVFSCNPKKL